TFLTTLWGRIAAARRPEITGPLPLVAAAVAASCICVGGVLMAGIAGSLLIGPAPMPGADLLRFGNGVGFAMVAGGGMPAAALSVACLSVQARTAGILGRPLMIFGLVVAVLLLGAIAFLPILVLLLWAIFVAVALLRQPATAA